MDMPTRQRVLAVVGTRPEAIKMAPVVRELQSCGWARASLVSTGQQSNLLDDALADLGLSPDVVFPHDPVPRTPAAFLGDCIRSLDAEIETWSPDCIVAQGDTTTVHAAAMAAFYRQLPFVHVEAGLRSGDMHSPFPEEYHRRAIALATTLHCAPTETAAWFLESEGISPKSIVMSGNTVIDALLQAAASNPKLPEDFPHDKRVVLLTLHRRENFGDTMQQALRAVRAFVDATPDVAVYFPLHPNPAARNAALSVLSAHPRIRLVEPLRYRTFVAVLKACWCVVTDSGGLQEEAPALGKPVLVLRDTTERPEAVEAGAAQLVGTSHGAIRQALTSLASDAGRYERMARKVFPYGDGRAARRIVDAMRQRMHLAGALDHRRKAA